MVASSHTVLEMLDQLEISPPSDRVYLHESLYSTKIDDKRFGCTRQPREPHGIALRRRHDRSFDI
jgi:hypothetical protein